MDVTATSNHTFKKNNEGSFEYFISSGPRVSLSSTLKSLQKSFLIFLKESCRGLETRNKVEKMHSFTSPCDDPTKTDWNSKNHLRIDLSRKKVVASFFQHQLLNMLQHQQRPELEDEKKSVHLHRTYGCK